VLAGGVVQVNLLVGRQVASFTDGAVAWLSYADRLYQLPLGVVGIAIGTALLPLLARELRAGHTDRAMANQNRAIEYGLLFSLPAALALWQLAEPIIRILFEHGRFSAEDTVRTSTALAAFAVGLPAFVVVKALTPGFFAREDTRTPLYIAIAAIATNIVLNVVFLYGTTLAQVGIALASSLSGWLNAALLAGVLWRRGQWAPDSRLRSRTPRAALATLGMGAVLWGALVLLAPSLAHGNLVGIAALLGMCALGGLVYAALGALLGVVRMSELRYVLRRQPGLRATDPGEQP
jgi:putative peptidoglycan lipid II flippase